MSETVRRLQNKTADREVLKQMIRRLRDLKARVLSSKRPEKHSPPPSNPPPLSNVPNVSSVSSVPNVPSVSSAPNMPSVPSVPSVPQVERVGGRVPPRAARPELEEEDNTGTMIRRRDPEEGELQTDTVQPVARGEGPPVAPFQPASPTRSLRASHPPQMARIPLVPQVLPPPGQPAPSVQSAQSAQSAQSVQPVQSAHSMQSVQPVQVQHSGQSVQSVQSAHSVQGQSTQTQPGLIMMHSQVSAGKEKLRIATPPTLANAAKPGLPLGGERGKPNPFNPVQVRQQSAIDVCANTLLPKPCPYQTVYNKPVG